MAKLFNALSDSSWQRLLNPTSISQWMEDFFKSRTLFACAIGIVLLGLIHYIVNVRTIRQLPNEPPIVPPDNAILGYLPSIFRYHLQFIDVLAERHLSRGILTIPLPGTRIYLVTTPTLISSIQSKSRHLSNNPLFTTWTLRWAGIKSNSDGAEKIRRDMDNHKVESWTSEIRNQGLKALAPGPGLERMRAVFIQRNGSFVTALSEKVISGQSTVDMWEYICHSVTVAGSTAVWGPSNPFEVHPDLWKTFWDFENDKKYITNNLPFGRKGYQAQAKLIKAFEEFHQDEEATERAGSFGKSRWIVNQRFDLSKSDNARIDIPGIVGQTANTVPATYGLLSYILCDNRLLTEIRQELDVLLTRESGGRRISFNALGIRQQCPLFVSTLYEVMRIISIGTTIRAIIEDLPLKVGEEQYILRKNATVYMAGGVVHTSSEFWDNPTSFQPDRFIKYSSPETQIPGLFRGFGGGNGLCGGRLLVVSEMLATVGSLLVRFDFDTDAAQLVLPRRKDIVFGQAMPKPIGNTVIKLGIRKGFEDYIWTNAPEVRDQE